MKILTKKVSYEQMMAIEPYTREKVRKQSIFFRWLIWFLSFFALLRVRFEYTKIGMEKLQKDQPCLILMNHTSFMDMEIAAKIFHDRPFQIVCTLDGFIGKRWLMRMLGCIPTHKYITDPGLVRDMVHSVRKLKSSILMYPEACYSFDGTATVLPESLGKCVKLLQVPVVMIRSYGLFQRNPLYNGLQNRKVKVTADVKYLLSPEEIKSKSPEELNRIIGEEFTFDHFRWQQENQVCVDEDFRADYLERVLYKCPHCQTEGKMQGKGIHLTCHSCGKQYELTEYGKMQAVEGGTEIDHVPDWYRWERECVRKEILNGTYHMETDVDIYVLINTKCMYEIGTAHLTHDMEGFRLTGFDGKMDYRQPPTHSYSLNADFYWYQIDDVVCIGDMDRQYCCIPKNKDVSVAKVRLATEEMYKIAKNEAKGEA